MKKATLSRILGLALALVLALSTSVAFALPSGTSAIEGLPEMPTVPTMTTAAKGNDITITLSEPLAWLNVLQNWNWNDIITWSDDKLTGTYSTKGLASQPGYATWKTTSAPEDGWPSWGSASWNVPYDEVFDDCDVVKSDSERHFLHWKGQVLVYIGRPYVDPNTLIVTTLPETKYEDAKQAEEAMNNLAEEVFNLSSEYPSLASAIANAATINDLSIEHWYDIGQAWGLYDMGNNLYEGTNGKGDDYSLGYAYNGATNDGTGVYYGRYGEVVQIEKTLTGVNFLGTDKSPTKTTVIWIPLEHYGKKAWNYFIYKIVEEYEDGSKLTAKFSSSMGGKLVGTKAE